MKKYWLTAAAILVVLGIAVGAFLLGRHGLRFHHDERPGGIDLQGRPIIEIGTAIQLAGKHVPGEVLKVELEREDGRYVYEVKVLAENGRVREVELDAQDGSLIEIEDN